MAHDPDRERSALEAESSVRRRRDTDGTVWTKAYVGNGSHFQNWLEQCEELAGKDNVHVERVEATGLACFQDGLYRIWIKQMQGLVAPCPHPSVCSRPKGGPMKSWHDLTDDLKTSPVLEKLEEAEILAIVEVLVLMIHADQTVAFMEEAELEHMLFELPSFKDKEDKIAARVKEAADNAASSDHGQLFEQAASKAAELLPDSQTREKVLLMAATVLATSDKPHPEEQRALNQLATAFGIDEARAQAIVSDAS